MILTYREPWQEQPPPFAAVLDRGHPLVAGLSFDLSPPVTLDCYNVVDGQRATRMPGVSVSPQKHGRGYATAQANDNAIDFGQYPVITGWPYSILVVTDSKNEASRSWVFSLRKYTGLVPMITLGLNAARDGSGSIVSAGTLYLYSVDSAGEFSSPTTGSAANAVLESAKYLSVASSRLRKVVIGGRSSFTPLLSISFSPVAVSNRPSEQPSTLPRASSGSASCSGRDSGRCR